MNFLEKFNTDDVFFRGLIIGLLRNMNDKITYYQTGSDQIKREVFIPFFYSMAGDEPFLQDFYLVMLIVMVILHLQRETMTWYPEE